MTRLRRRRRRGERGQGFWEWAVLGAGILAVGTFCTCVLGAWGAATYDQQHSRTALATATATPTAAAAPSLVFTDFSPVGPHQDCLLQVAATYGLTWDGGGLGWTSAAHPRPTGQDALDPQKVRDWQVNMLADVSTAAGSDGWQRCSQPDLPTPAATTPPPEEPTVAVDGQYTVDPNGIQAIGGCGSDPGPTAMQVSGNGTSVIITLAAGSTTMNGTFDATSGAIDASMTDSRGAKHTVHGSISGNAGVTRFSGTYDIEDQISGCGYTFTAQKNS